MKRFPGLGNAVYYFGEEIIVSPVCPLIVEELRECVSCYLQQYSAKIWQFFEIHRRMSRIREVRTHTTERRIALLREVFTKRGAATRRSVKKLHVLMLVVEADICRYYTRECPASRWRTPEGIDGRKPSARYAATPAPAFHASYTSLAQAEISSLHSTD